MECNMEEGKPIFPFTTMPIKDDGVYEYTCKKGHKTVVVLQEQKYEILFEKGAYALLDGYPDSAVTRFAVSLERFYEFYIKVMLLKQGFNLQDFEKMWKQMSKQSERQFGAFLVLYELDKLQSNSAILPSLPDVTELRNKVVHKGYIPSDEEAKEYGKIIFDFITGMQKHIKECYSEEINKIVSDKLYKVKEKKNLQKCPETRSQTTVINFNYGENRTFEDGLLHLMRYRDIILENKESVEISS